MKILFDQGTPVPLRRHLGNHTVDTAYEKGWSDLKNGELLKKAEQNGYQILITTDQNLRYQQDLKNRKLAVIVLMSTSWPRIQLWVENIKSIVDQIKEGDYQEILISSDK